MDDEIEDLVGDVKYTNSQKSVATSNVYSMDFTDSSSDKNNSSGKETYVIEWDDSSEGSEKPHELDESKSVINIKEESIPCVLVNQNTNSENLNGLSKSTSTTIHKYQEIFTQTSKTIIELAETERKSSRNIHMSNTLRTETSLISITENKTVEYRINMSDDGTFHDEVKNQSDNETNNCNDVTFNMFLSDSLEDGSSKLVVSEIEIERTKGDSESDIVRATDTTFLKDAIENIKTEEVDLVGNNSSDKSSLDSDIDEDSLMCNEYNFKNCNADDKSDTSESPKSIDSEVEDLYKKLAERIYTNVEPSCDQEAVRFCTLTPLTEENTVKQESLMDITPICNNIIGLKEDDKYFLFVNKSGIKVKVVPDDILSADSREHDVESLKLPPIERNLSCPSTPHLNDFAAKGQRPGILNMLFEGEKKEWSSGGRWEIGSKDLAAGESLLITGRSDPVKKANGPCQLPPIHAEGNTRHNNQPKLNKSSKANANVKKSPQLRPPVSINIKDKITELKIRNSMKYSPEHTKYKMSITESRTSRSVSPESRSAEESRLVDLAERGCEALCLELLKRLKSPSWFEVSDTLEELPKVMEKFWAVVSENRTADLIRHVSAHVDSPRTQVAKEACSTLAAILKHTNYTKKPDFYEAVTCLLAKTGSYSRPVRRAANVALDAVVCGVGLAHAVTALCVHGVSHKSPLVRCAAARLLVVCCALGGGGRELLRTRPLSAASARRLALRALAALLEDKTTETRKYAERLYSMLRPLSNFDAFYLTDVEVEVASRQMKKFDQLLLCAPPSGAR